MATIVKRAVKNAETPNPQLPKLMTVAKPSMELNRSRQAATVPSIARQEDDGSTELALIIMGIFTIMGGSFVLGYSVGRQSKR